MFRTEDAFFDDHVQRLLDGLDARVREIETGDYTPEDVMELSALDRLMVILEEL